MRIIVVKHWNGTGVELWEVYCHTCVIHDFTISTTLDLVASMLSTCIYIYIYIYNIHIVVVGQLKYMWNKCNIT